MKKTNGVCSSGSGGFKVGCDQNITMADIEENERNLKIAEEQKSNKRL